MAIHMDCGPKSVPQVSSGYSAWRYCFSGIQIDADFSIPELCEWDGATQGQVRITLSNGSVGRFARSPIERECRLPDGTLWTTCQRAGSGWIVDFPAYGGFLIAGDGGGVCCFPAPGTEMGTIRHLLLNQIMPLVMSVRGRYALHASAVEIAGHAAVFTGASGEGKSTLALHFALSGNRFLADDLVAIETAGTSLAVLPSYPSLRVWSDILELEGKSDLAAASGAGYSEKARILAGNGIEHQNAPAALGAIYLLGRDAAGVKVRKVGGVDAVIELVRASFVLDAGRTGGLEPHLEWVAKLASTGRLFRLDYPRDFARLGETSEAIARHVRSVTCHG